MRVFILFLSLCVFPLFSEEDKILLPPHGEKTLEWVLELIDSSQQSIEIANPFLGGEVGLKILERIEKRMVESHLHFHLLVHPIYVTQNMKTILHRMEALYPNRFSYCYTNEIPSSTQNITAMNNHMKLMIFDEKYFIVGGTNFFDEGCCEGLEPPEKAPPTSIFNLCSASRDNDVVGKGEVAQELRKNFFRLYAIWENYQLTKVLEITFDSLERINRYFPLSDTQPIANFRKLEQTEEFVPVSSIKMVFGNPVEVPNKIATEYKELISHSKSSISIGNLFFHPNEDLMHSLMNAANRDVNIQVITNGYYEGISPKVASCFAWANRLSYTPIFYGRNFYFWQSNEIFSSPLKATKIYEYCVKDTMYHKKTMVVDARYLVIGSFNLGLKSCIGDFELILVIDSPKIAKKMLEIYRIDQEHSREVTPSQANDWYFDPWVAYIGSMQKKISGLI